ncbi:MAG: Ku protein [Oxalicibacterium faecigallinarum]|uniref:non-homologous end joining protein Ku n=1 Tax=Oxalicibacterium faecigallinarum TaxID=573741 RepID=UPI0028091797|nr:Ku protein [Oxalicibacterium faecigallinarum]MDQ7970128.1 Ku protein [Oxalicibacterium faecigallinarum]
MASTSKRILWKGAISFGLVHIPIALHSATQESGLNFDWLDKRTMDPVGYKRINKKTGKEVSKENIVKGIEVEDGHYVILSPEEIDAAYPKTTQTIEIEAFVSATAIPFVYFERPYYISPINKGAKVYALLREILLKTGKVGLAKVVIQTKQHLAVLVPAGPALVLNLLRWGDEIRTWDQLDLPKEGAKAAGLTEKEIRMGEQLVEDMSGDWSPEDFTDSFKEQILHLVEEKVKAGETETVTPVETVETGESAKIYDLTDMLQRSLKGGKPNKSAPATKSASAAGKKVAKKSTARKSATKTTSSKVAAKRKSA